MSNEELLDQFSSYLRSIKNRSHHTVDAYLNDIKFFIDYFDNQNVCEITHKQIRHYTAYLSKSNFKSSSIRRKISSLQSFFRYLKKNGLVCTIPTALITRPKLTRKIRDIPKEQELAQMPVIQVVDTLEDKEYEYVRDFCIVELLYGTGVRRQELIDLKLSDVRLNERCIKVTGKGNKQRIIPLSDYLCEILSFYLKIREKAFKESEPNLFLTKKGIRVNKSLVYVIVKSYLSAVSDVYQKSPHMLRHAFATHMLNRGADLRSIRELLGHSSLAATQIYTQNDIQKLKSVYNRFHPRSN